MENKIDTEKLQQHIGELNSLYSEWSGYTKKVEDIGNNSGRAVSQMTEITKSLQALQEGFVSLLNNTISYMSQRKESIDTKENEAKEKVSK